MNYQMARQAMIDSQIRTGNVTNAEVLAAFAETPRELFLPEAHRALAYCDRVIEIAKGRYLTEPMVLARLMEVLQLRKNEKVLVVGAGTGYAAAILAKLAGKVIAFDSDANLLKKAEENFKQLQLSSIVTVQGMLADGVLREGPYDAILLDGAAEYLPKAWLQQLAEGGRLAAIIEDQGVGKATLYERAQQHSGHKVLFDAWIPILPGLKQKQAFVFA